MPEEEMRRSERLQMLGDEPLDQSDWVTGLHPMDDLLRAADCFPQLNQRCCELPKRHPTNAIDMGRPACYAILRLEINAEKGRCAMAVITMSRQRGSKGSYIALEVARRMDLRYLDREILDSVARQAGVQVAQLEAIEARAGRLPRVLHLLGARPKLPTVGSASLREQANYEARVGELMMMHDLDRDAAAARLQSEGLSPYQPSQDYLDLTNAVILDYAQQGDAMIVGRGGQMILRRRLGVLHVQFVGKFENRVHNICKREDVKWREAAHRLRQADEERAGYMRRFYGVDWLDPRLYDLVLNTDQIPDEVAVNMIVLAAEAVHEAAAEAPLGG